MKALFTAALGVAMLGCVGGGSSGGGAFPGGDSGTGSGTETATGTGTGTGTANGTASQSFEFCSKYWGLVCQHDMACGKWTSAAACGAIAGIYANVEDCAISVSRSLANGKVKVDMNGFLSCLSGIASTCGATNEECQAKFFVGKRNPGDPCLDSKECAPKAFCVKTGGDCSPGVCQSYLKAGEPCGNAGFCATGLTCDGKVCVATKAAGAPCGSSLECGSNTTCYKGTCTPPGNLTNLCTGTAKLGCVCSGEVCDTGADGKSTCKLTCSFYQDKGAPCSDSPASVNGIDILSRCKKDLRCDPATKTCIDPIADGGKCDPKNSGQCKWGTCDATALTCAALPTEGQPCTKACAGNVSCVMGKCGKRLETGAACNTGNDCQSDSCGQDNTCSAICPVP